MDSANGIIAAMRAVAPSGLVPAGKSTLKEMQALTRELLAARSVEAREEYARFLAIGQRRLAVPEAELGAWLGDKTILVTGGTGCVGSSLTALAMPWRPYRIISISRGLTSGWAQSPGIRYERADIRDRRRLADIVRLAEPDVIFHLAAERDTSLAEREVRRTVSTNVLGTRNVLAVAAEYRVPQVVLASTGKALRPYSSLVYTASKNAAEWLSSRTSVRGETRCSAARFTHVVNNSKIHRLLLDWCASGVIRLHSDDIFFYAQSAVESAQLLLCAGLGARDGQFLVHAVTDLGWPVSLLDLALGVLDRTGSSAPILFSGYDQGYESEPFPGLYDPATADDTSPLVSIFEAYRAERSQHGIADAFPLDFASESETEKRFQALEDACEIGDSDDPAAVRLALDELSWSSLDDFLRLIPAQVLFRALKLASPYRERLNSEHRRLLEAIRRSADGG